MTTGRKRGKSIWSKLLLVCVATAILYGFTPSAMAQDAPRKTKVAVRPEYSALAQRMSLVGVVRIEVVILPNGKVRKAHVIGGHPVLAADAEKAALLTEFEPGPKESTQVLEFKFGPSQN